MITKMSLQFGAYGQDHLPLEIEVGAITIFVGPNNSGKSLILREIEGYCVPNSPPTHIIKSLKFNLPTDAELEKLISGMSQVIQAEEGGGGDSKIIKNGRFNCTKGYMQANQSQNWIVWKNTPTHLTTFQQFFIPMFISRLDGKARFNLVSNQQCGDLLEPPKNCLMHLAQNNILRQEVRNIIYEAFQKYFTIDPTNMGQMRIKLSDKEPPKEDDVEIGWRDASIKYHALGKPISEFSDGVLAFTGLAMTTLAGEEKIMLIDEPEAFLHASLATLLGKKLSEIMAKRDGNLIVSTHSPFFLMGCLQSGKSLNIVRLAYDGKKPTARLLSDARIKDLFKDPLLRSLGVMQALFYSNVIVTEGDADRSFYNEINERLSQEGIKNCIFLHAQNKQTIWKIVQPLREMGIPAVGIVDIDFIKDGGQEFVKALDAIGVPSQLHDSFGALRAKIKQAFEDTQRDMTRNGGIALLSNGDLEMCKKFSQDLQDYGLFMVEGGELESWLPELKIAKHGPAWLIEIFSRIGSDPNDVNYLKPSAGDVWDFMRKIKAWAVNPDKKGMVLKNVK